MDFNKIKRVFIVLTLVVMAFGLLTAIHGVVYCSIPTIFIGLTIVIVANALYSLGKL